MQVFANNHFIVVKIKARKNIAIAYMIVLLPTTFKRIYFMKVVGKSFQFIIIINIYIIINTLEVRKQQKQIRVFWILQLKIGELNLNQLDYK